MFKRPVYNVIRKRILEPRRFIQVLSGPRQTGKTTLAHQIIENLGFSSHYTTSDEPILKNSAWIIDGITKICRPGGAPTRIEP
jgi:predicted AAA+ superfamily ATPase